MPGELSFTERILAALRGRNTRRERVCTAVATTETLFDEIETFARPGMTQKDPDFVHSRIDGMGLGYAWPKPFNPIVTCGPESAMGHAAPGDAVLQRGHLLHVDLGIKENGYCLDLQRMWYVLDVRDGSTAGRAARVYCSVGISGPGERATTGSGRLGVDEAARDFIVDNGYPEYMHALVICSTFCPRRSHGTGTALGAL
ncbi:MAG: M24 family metallopeptidase [Chloroflexota bacterium]